MNQPLENAMSRRQTSYCFKVLSLLACALGPICVIFSSSSIHAASISQLSSSASRVDLASMGARCDVQIIEWHDVSIDSGNRLLTVDGGTFNGDDVGKRIVVIGAGAKRFPLISTIATVIAHDKLTLHDTALTSVTKKKAWVAYGSDDSQSIASAIRSLPAGKGGEVIFPAQTCGVTESIELPRIAGNLGRPQLTVRGRGRGASLVVALAPMDSILHEPGGWHQQTHISEIGLEAAGVANYALHVEGGGYGAQYREVDFADGAIAALRVGSEEINTDGTVKASWFAPTSEIQMMQSSATVLKEMFPQGLPPFAILMQGGDSHFTDVIAKGAGIANIRDTSGANNFYTAVHSYGVARYAYWINGHALFTNCEVDGASEAGVRVDSGDVVWLGGHMFFPNQQTEDVYGFLLEGDNARSAFIGLIINDIAAKNFIGLRRGVPPSPERISIL